MEQPAGVHFAAMRRAYPCNDAGHIQVSESQLACHGFLCITAEKRLQQGL